jgi:Type II secretion system (T2SS), protein E, N-terminal domain
MQEAETALCGQDYLIPQMRDLRRIPMRYQSILPLKVMKQYQCAVVGSAQGIVTVAITDCDPSLIKTLTKLIGRPIFPVWVKPARMGLLIKRMEQREHRKDKMLRWPSLLNSFEIHMAVIVLTDHMKEKK